MTLRDQETTRESAAARPGVAHRLGALAVLLGLVTAACAPASQPPAPAAATAAPAATLAATAPAAAAKPASPVASPAAAASPSPAAGGATAAATKPAAPAANVSGSITVYGALTEANGAALAKAFQDAYPQAKVEMVTAGTGPLVTRIDTERRAGGVRADVILLADPTVMPGLKDNDVLADYVPAAASGLPAGLKGTGWVGAFTFNNMLISRQGATAPKDWQDLTTPAFTGKVELGDPAASGTTLGMVGYLSKTLGWDYFKNLQKNGAKVVQSTNTVGTDVAQGSVTAGITLDSVARDLKSKGSPIEMVWPQSGAIPVPAPAALVKGRESEVGRAFVDWLLTPQGQAQLVKLGYAPALGTSDAVPAGVKLVDVDWAQITKDRASILEQFKAIFS